ncbi:MAG TPA: DUF6079 family protein [Alphaproteobacteria bacterium]|nr:DUF6079 family protein [Alphaproteobacteria bacterium]
MLVTDLAGLVHAGDIGVAIIGDKIDAGKLTLLAERSLNELKHLKHVAARRKSTSRSSDRCSGRSPSRRAGQGAPRRSRQALASVLERQDRPAGRPQLQNLSRDYAVPNSHSCGLRFED